MIILDTNVIAETMRQEPNHRVLAWLGQAQRDLAIATVCVAELSYGIARIRPEQRAARLDANLNAWLERLEGRIYPFDENAALICGEIRGIAARRGRPLAMIDAMIAATALRFETAVATRNVRDFDVPDLVVINPWLV